MEFCSGLTLSGGDPLYPDNRNEVMRIVETVKGEFGNEKTIWLYTGYRLEDIEQSPLLHYVDVLVDGPFVEAEKDAGLPFRGSRNQRIIQM